MFLLTVLFAGFLGWFDQLNFDFNPKTVLRSLYHSFYFSKFSLWVIILNLKYQNFFYYHPQIGWLNLSELGHVRSPYEPVFWFKILSALSLCLRWRFFISMYPSPEIRSDPSPRCCVGPGPFKSAGFLIYHHLVTCIRFAIPIFHPTFFYESGFKSISLPEQMQPDRPESWNNLLFIANAFPTIECFVLPGNNTKQIQIIHRDIFD
jgi:hypothetical protein